MTTLLIATHNEHKIQEIRAILGNSFQLLTLDDFPGAPKVVEDADTFAGNATKKALTLARWVQSSEFKVQDPEFFVLADDSGLKVDALNGAPGVHSARFAVMDSGKPGNSSDADNNAKLLRLLKNVPREKRAARFRCAMALARAPLGKIECASPVCYADEFEAEMFNGVCHGKIIFEPRGKNGFGYDPLFMPDGFDQTFAELGDEVKNKISHRAMALEKVRDYLSKRPS